jgi:ribulose-5-phosphate 4-epimerase/fuculose-1-phosphate aldolase
MQTVELDATLAAPVRPQDASFAVNGEPVTPSQRWLVDGLVRTMLAHGHPLDPSPRPDTAIVFHLVDAERPKPYRRRSAPTFVLAIVEASSAPDDTEDLLRLAYPYLVRSLANLCMYTVPEAGRASARFVTLEQGVYRLAAHAADDEWFETVYDRVAPLALSRLVIDNEFVPDLPAELWDGDETTAQIHRAGRRLDALDLLPSPFPLDRILSTRDYRHVQKLYGLGGLSYGNVSARYDAERFWMSASGVDKSDMRVVGEQICFVEGFDAERRVIRLRVPPHVTPRRVSVDAIEHYMIYREHPEVGAIVHIHAWMDDIVSTEINYPCGTVELARSVADLVREAPDPGRAVVGLKNHGLTITGPSLDEIFERIDGRVTARVPMS